MVPAVILRWKIACFALVLGAPALSQAVEPEPSSGTDALIKSLVLATLPREYENTKHWGATKPRWDGLHISLDGLQLKTKRRWKDVNHGTWTRYRATLIDPERQLVIQTQNLRPVADKRVAFDLTVDARLDLMGRLSEWRQGVQLYSFSAEADATVRLTMTCEVGLTFDTSASAKLKFPPDVLLVPHVTAADLVLRDFNLHAISDADGPLIRKLGDRLHDVLQDEIHERRQKIVAKINRAIDKRSDKLRLSLHDVVTSGWSKVLPEGL
jgi:hypothetical protein